MTSKPRNGRPAACTDAMMLNIAWTFIVLAFSTWLADAFDNSRFDNVYLPVNSSFLSWREDVLHSWQCKSSIWMIILKASNWGQSRYWGQNSYGAGHSDTANWQKPVSFYCNASHFWWYHLILWQWPKRYLGWCDKRLPYSFPTCLFWARRPSFHQLGQCRSISNLVLINQSNVSPRRVMIRTTVYSRERICRTVLLLLPTLKPVKRKEKSLHWV